MAESFYWVSTLFTSYYVKVSLGAENSLDDNSSEVKWYEEI